MSCRRRARVPVPRRQTPAGAEDTSSRDSLVIVIRCAQRRPERQPRRHRLLLVSGFVRVFNAQRRPERQPRRHWHGCEYVGCLRRRRSTKARASTPATPPPPRVRICQGFQRSTKAGASTPATLARVRVCRLFTQEALNEGRSVNPGYTWIWKPEIPTSGNAQRRPERQPRRHRSKTDRHPMSGR